MHLYKLIFLCLIPIHITFHASEPEIEPGAEGYDFKTIMQNNDFVPERIYKILADSPGLVRQDNVNTKKNGQTLLHRCVLFSEQTSEQSVCPPFSVAALLDLKADACLPTDKGDTPLDIAVSKQKHDFGLVQKLLDAKAQVSAKTFTCLEQTQRKIWQTKLTPTMRTLLLTYKEQQQKDEGKEDASEEQPDFTKLMQDETVRLAEINKLLQKHPKMLTPANVNTRKNGNTLLHTLVYFNNLDGDFASYDERYQEKLVHLISLKADVSAPDKDGYAPLAVLLSHASINFGAIRALVHAKADLSDKATAPYTYPCRMPLDTIERDIMVEYIKRVHIQQQLKQLQKKPQPEREEHKEKSTPHKDKSPTIAQEPPLYHVSGVSVSSAPSKKPRPTKKSPVEYEEPDKCLVS